METTFLTHSIIAGILASIACGFGAFPLLIKQLDIKKNVGLGYGFAGGLMFSASVYNLILPGLTLGESVPTLKHVILIIVGIIFGALFLWGVNVSLTPERLESNVLKVFESKTEILIFIAMSFHSIPEGVAVGVGYASAEHVTNVENLGNYIAIAIAIHNIPEGLAVAIPMRSRGASIWRCFFVAFLTSLPQPIAAVPASLLVWFFKPLMVPFLGFAAGAMIFLVIMEMIPDALEDKKASHIAWAFIFGFCLMILVQVLL